MKQVFVVPKKVYNPPQNTFFSQMSELDRSLSQMLASTADQVTQLTEACTALSADEASLESKIENKAAQLERNQKRHSSLMNVRPAFMDEYDLMETELHKQYRYYLEQFRNLGYLEYELAKYNKKEDALMEEQENKLHAMRERLRKEELEVLRGQRVPDDSLLDLKRDRDLEMQLENEEQGRVVRAEQQQAGILGGRSAQQHGVPSRGGPGPGGAGAGGDDRKVRGSSARGQKRPRPESGRPQVKPRAVKAEGDMYGDADSDDSEDLGM